MVKPAELAEIEQAVNRTILADLPVVPTYKNYSELRNEIAAGEIMALFGEKYGDVVRVMRIGDEAETYSQELCGGTHVSRTAQIGALHITSEGSAAAGIRRIEAVTGRAAQDLIQQRLQTLEKMAGALGVQPEAVDERMAALQAQLQEKEKEIKQLQRKVARAEFEELLTQAHQVAGVNVIALKVAAPDATMLREMSDWFRDKLGSAVVVLATVSEGKPSLIATVTEDLTKRGLHAGNIIKAVAQVVGGGGGGKPSMAQAGGKDASRLDEGLAQVDELVRQMVI
jgi:alanyl-tRNA synthetase